MTQKQDLLANKQFNVQLTHGAAMLDFQLVGLLKFLLTLGDAPDDVSDSELGNSGLLGQLEGTITPRILREQRFCINSYFFSA